MWYESFKLELAARLQSAGLPVIPILDCLDSVAASYTFEKRTTALSVVTPLAEQSIKLFIAAKAVEEKSLGTLKTYRSYLKTFFDHTPKDLKDITTNDIRSFLFHVKTNHHYANDSLETVRRIINNFLEFCVAEEILAKNPCKRIKPIKCEKKSRNAMKPIELEYARECCRSPRERAVVEFLYSTGCRVSELCNVKLSNIDWDKKTVLIEHGKGNVTRVTYLSARCELLLRAYLASRTDASEYLFTRERCKSTNKLTPECIQRLIKKIVSRSDQIKTKVTPHVFRHTVATIALKNGMPVEQVKSFLGHANINTTLIYAEVDNDEVRHSHAKYVA